MVVVDSGRKEQLEVVLSRTGVPGWTELQGTGLGTTGPRLASAAFPRESAVVFSLLENAEALRVAGELKTYCHDCGGRARIVSWPVDET